ncbi:MAG TPA: phage tail sheath subtilisin-like domain-containing protein [Kofleriaceae bacterium]|nr:phage tail sheath subtilisin-like domain-containing protein [Kofleriaceae bacterium]
MAISFNSIPSNLRVPWIAVEFDSSRAQQGPALLAYRAILIGQKLAAGTAAANTILRVTSPEQVIPLAGRGSMLHRMAIAWFASNRSTELWIGVLADDAAGVAASGTITVTGAATKDGTIAGYFGGERIPVGVRAGDANNTIAAAINTAISANPDLPITSTVAGNTLTVTFRHKGVVGTGYDIRHSFRDGEALPAGVTLAISPVTGGTSNPSLTALLAVMGDLWFQIWAHPYLDATNLAAIETELLSRSGPMRQLDGVAITHAAGTFSVLTTLGTSRNSPYSTIVAPPGASPLTPPMELAAEVAALVAFHGAIDPARPFQTLALTRALPTAETDQWSLDERNLLLFSGIATTRVAAGGVVQLDRMITTYQTNPAGAVDTAYLDVTTPLTLMFLRFSFRTRFQTKYPRHKLADDDARFAAGQAVMTPKLGRTEALGWFRDMESLGLVEGFEQFKRDLVVTRSATDPNRLEFLLPPDLMNQFIAAAAQIQFRL